MSDSSNALVLELSTNSGKTFRCRPRFRSSAMSYVAKSAGNTELRGVGHQGAERRGCALLCKRRGGGESAGRKPPLTTDNSTYSRLAFTLPANGSIVKVFLKAEHTKNAASPLDSVQAAVRDITDAGIADI